MIRLAKPTLKRKDMDAVLNTMVDETISPGERYREFSLLLKEYFGAEHCSLYRSYVRALRFALQIIGIGQESRIVISVLSPAWYLDVIRELGSEVLLADVDPRTGCIDIESVKGLLKKKPSAILSYAPLGNLPDYDKLEQIPLPIIEDISESFGSLKVEKNPGFSASVIVAAFEENSVITTGGGAAVIVRDKKYVKPLNDLTGMTRNLELMSDLSAALGISQMKSLDSLLERRREYLELFRNALQNTRHKLIAEHNDEVLHNGMTFPVLLDSRIQDVNKFTRRYKIETANPFQWSVGNILKVSPDLYPNSTPFLMRTMLFPLYPLLSQEQRKTLVKVLTTLP